MNNDFFTKIINASAIRIAIVGALFALTIVLLVLAVFIWNMIGRSGIPATDTITVQGRGEAILVPNVVHITFTMENIAPAVADAQAVTTKQTNAALAFIKEQNILEKDIKTLSYNISPEYRHPDPCYPGVPCPMHWVKPRLIGYRVSQTIQVTVRDLAIIGDILSGLGKKEVKNISGPVFALDDVDAGYNAAREDAINNAKLQAKMLAEQLDIRLGKIVNFSESSRDYIPFPPMTRAMRGETMTSNVENVPEIPAGENIYTAFVTIIYEIR